MPIRWRAAEVGFEASARAFIAGPRPPRPPALRTRTRSSARPRSRAAPRAAGACDCRTGRAPRTRAARYVFGSTHSSSSSKPPSLFGRRRRPRSATLGRDDQLRVERVAQHGLAEQEAERGGRDVARRERARSAAASRSGFQIRIEVLSSTITRPSGAAYSQRILPGRSTATVPFGDRLGAQRDAEARLLEVRAQIAHAVVALLHRVERLARFVAPDPRRRARARCTQAARARYSSGGRTKISRGLVPSCGPTMPSASICSRIRADRL